MQIENKTVVVNEGIFLKAVTPSGKTVYKACTVLDVMEQPLMLKLRYPHGEQFKRDWFPASQCIFKVPSPEEQKQANANAAEKEAA